MYFKSVIVTPEQSVQNFPTSEKSVQSGEVMVIS